MGARLGEVRIRLLGGLVVEGIEGSALGSRKARLLLKRLALGRQRAIPSDDLIEVLWSDDHPSKPNDQLGVLVSRLRGVLGADRIPHRDSGYALELDWLDVEELSVRVDEASAARAAGRLAAARAAAHAAISLARGPLLPDDDGDWVVAERAWCTSTVMRAHHIAAEASLAAGDPDAAAAASESALLADPYDETALRVLMRAHAAAGRPASGLAAYVRVRDRIAEDLGVNPTGETESLHDELVLGELRSVAEVTGIADVAAIVGRERELATLDGALARATGGEAVSVIVSGEPGIGKTALVEAWRQSLGGIAVVTCRCDPLGRDLPLQPLLDGIARHLEPLGPAADALVGDDSGILSSLLGLNAVAGGATITRDPEVGRAQLFTALLTVVGRLGSGPVVLIIEDVHDAGASTFVWISFAMRRGRNLLVVATTRSRATAIPDAVQLDVGPLRRDAAEALLAGLDLVDERTADDLVSRSAGNPLFLLALARASGEELPASIREAVDRQADLLGSAAPTVRAAAIIGGDIDLDLLADVLAAQARDVLADLERACSAGLLEERASGFAFRHELVREALDSGAGSARRALVHRDVARVLDLRTPRDPLVVAVHARLGGEKALAIDAYVAAAQAAFGRSDVGAAFGLLESAIELGPNAAAHALRAKVRLAMLDLNGAERDAAEAVALGGGAAALEISAWVAYYRRRYDEARAFADAGADQAPDLALELSCRAVGGRVRHGAGDLVGAAERLDVALTAAPEVRGVADVWLAHLRVHQGRPTEALALAHRAMTNPDRLAHPFAPLHGRFARIMALGQLGRVDEALVACAELEEARRTSGAASVRFEGIAANMRGWLLRNVGCFGLADESNERALVDHAEQARLSAVGLTEAYWVAVLDLIDGRLLVGDIDGAERRLAAASGLDDWQGTMAWHQRQRLGLLRARLAIAHGEEAAALDLAEAVRADAATRGSRRYELLASAWVARCDPRPDLERVGQVVEGLASCARLEAWRLTSDLATRLRVDELRGTAERMAADVMASAGAHRDTARAWMDRFFSATS